MSGVITPGALADVIRLIGGKQYGFGYLLVHNQKTDGRIWFKDGAIIAAECGPARDEPAIRCILGLTFGKFAFVDDPDLPDRTIFKDTPGILLECSGQIDNDMSKSQRQPSDCTVSAIIEGSKSGEKLVPVTEVRPMPATQSRQSTPIASFAADQSGKGQAATPAKEPMPERDSSKAATDNETHASSKSSRPPDPISPNVSNPGVIPPLSAPQQKNASNKKTLRQKPKRLRIVAAITLIALGGIVLFFQLMTRQPGSAPSGRAMEQATNVIDLAALPESTAPETVAQAAGPARTAAWETSANPAAATNAEIAFAANEAADFEGADIPTLSADWPNLKLSGLMIAQGKKGMAIINGKSLQEGSIINGVGIMEITRTGILVQCSGETRFMPFKRSDAQKEHAQKAVSPGFGDVLRRLFGK